MPRGPHLTLAEQAQIDVLKKNGLSLRNIASQLNRSVYCIFHYCQNPQGYGQKKRCGRPRLLTKHDERHIGRLVSSSTLSANQLRQRLQLKVKKDTILRSIHRNKQQRMPFYAVAHGFKPDVYEDWSEAKKQIDKFPQPVYKKFDNKEEAEEYFTERRPTEVVEEHPDEDTTKTFYAVARGKTIGIFADYDVVKESIDGYPQPLQKKFTALKDAIAYYEKFANGKVEASEEPEEKEEKTKSKTGKKASADKPVTYYAVARGHETGVFLTWDECKKQTTDFKGARFKKFDNEEDAKKFAEGKTLKQIEESRKRGAGDAEPSPPKKSKK